MPFLPCPDQGKYRTMVYHLIRVAPQVKPPPKEQSNTISPASILDARFASSRAMGIEAADVLPYFWTFMKTFSAPIPEPFNQLIQNADISLMRDNQPDGIKCDLLLLQKRQDGLFHGLDGILEDLTPLHNDMDTWTLRLYQFGITAGSCVHMEQTPELSIRKQLGPDHPAIPLDMAKDNGSGSITKEDTGISDPPSSCDWKGFPHRSPESSCSDPPGYTYQPYQGHRQILSRRR